MISKSWDKFDSTLTLNYTNLGAWHSLLYYANDLRHLEVTDHWRLVEVGLASHWMCWPFIEHLTSISSWRWLLWNYLRWLSAKWCGAYWPRGLTLVLRSITLVMWMLEMAHPRMFTGNISLLIWMEKLPLQSLVTFRSNLDPTLLMFYKLFVCMQDEVE